jgi:hypothetical protein
MTKAQVEAILGPPNEGQFDLIRKKQAMWDASPMLGFQYISMTVQYDADGNVEGTIRLYEVRDTPPWARWKWPEWRRWWQ